MELTEDETYMFDSTPLLYTLVVTSTQDLSVLRS